MWYCIVKKMERFQVDTLAPMLTDKISYQSHQPTRESHKSIMEDKSKKDQAHRDTTR